MHASDVGGGVGFLQGYGPKFHFKQNQCWYLKYLTNFSAIALRIAEFRKAIFHFQAFSELKEWETEEGRAKEYNYKFKAVKMEAGSASSASFRFDRDCTRTAHAGQSPMVGGTLGLITNPRTMTSWPMNLGYSFDNISLILWLRLEGSGSQCDSLMSEEGHFFFSGME